MRNKIIAISILLVLQLSLLLYFGSQKQGMHFDEFFSYFNTNSSAGRQAFDRSWVASEEIRQDFYVKPGEQFQYGTVVKLQGYDVHPPVFYILLHTLCSFMPGVYSIWQGLVLNICYALLTTVFWYLILQRFTKSDLASFLICLFLIVNPGIISNVMFIRMYCLMTLFISISVWLHIRMAEEGIKTGYIILNAVLAYLGFLTHYFYLVFLFFIEGAFVLNFLWKKHREKKNVVEGSGTVDGKKNGYASLIVYCAALLAAGILAVICFPQCLGHVHSGYRGKEVQSYLFDLSDFGPRFSFFTGLMNKYVFGGRLFIFAAVAACVLILLLFYGMKNGRKKTFNAEGGDAKGWLFLRVILIPVLGYYLVSVKSSLMGDEAMMRYQLPIYGLIFLSFWYLLWTAFETLRTEKEKHPEVKKAYLAGQILLVLFVLLLPLPDLIGKKNVFYLYPEQEMMKKIAGEHSDDTCLYIYNNEENKYLLWNDSEQLWQYDAVYFASSENTAPIDDPKIGSAEELVVYVSTMNEIPDFSVYEDLVFSSDPNLHHYEKLYDAMYATAYRFYQ